MAAKVTTQAGDISLAATWDGGLPAATDTCTLAHACTLPTGKTFTAVSLDLAGFALVCTGVGTITAEIIALETLDDSAATDLLIDGNAATTIGAGWNSNGVTHITGTLDCDGTGGTNIYGLSVVGTLTVDTGITATGTGSGYGVYNSGAIIGDVTGTNDDGIGVYNLDTITGAVTGTSTSGLGEGVYNSGTITGDVTGESTSGSAAGVYNDGTITGAVTGTTDSDIGIHNDVGGVINLIGLLSGIAPGGTPIIDSGTIQSVVPAAVGDVRLATPRYTPDGPNGTLDITADNNPFQVFRIGG